MSAVNCAGIKAGVHIGLKRRKGQITDNTRRKRRAKGATIGPIGYRNDVAIHRQQVLDRRAAIGEKKPSQIVGHDGEKTAGGGNDDQKVSRACRLLQVFLILTIFLDCRRY